VAAAVNVAHEVDVAKVPVAASTRPHITIRGLAKRFNEMVVYDKFDSRHSARQDHFGVRTERLRQEYADQPDGGPDPDGRRRDSVSTDSRSRTSRSAMSSRTIAKRCFPGCARATISSIRSNS